MADRVVRMLVPDTDGTITAKTPKFGVSFTVRKSPSANLQNQS
jgi:hypothetical protein